MSYYRQYDYGHVPYTHRDRPHATVRTSGCGPCCISMAVEELTGAKFPPERSASMAMACGARLSGGTDMMRLAKKAASSFNLTLTATGSMSDLISAVVSGGVCIANTGGDRQGYKGLFSNGGHFVLVKGAQGGRLQVWDPGYYRGKFGKEGRKGRAEVRGHDILVSPSELAADCRNRRPAYYILEDNVDRYRSIDDIPKGLREEAAQLVSCGALKGQGDERGLDISGDMLRCIIAAKRYADIKAQGMSKKA